MNIHEGGIHVQCNTFISNKKTRITLSKRILDELEALNKRRTIRINTLILTTLARRKHLELSSLNISDVLDEIETLDPELSRNDQRYLENLLGYCKDKLGGTKYGKDLHQEVRLMLSSSMKQFLYLKSVFIPKAFQLNGVLVRNLFSITTNQSDSEHLSDAFNWHQGNPENKYFVTHDSTDILTKSPQILAEMKSHSPNTELELTPVRRVIHQ